MITNNRFSNISGHRMALLAVLCLFGLSILCAAGPKKKHRKKSDERVYLIQADELKYE